MDEIFESLSVLFEEPFWIGVFETKSNGRISVCKVTFGAEPKDYEIWQYVNDHFYGLRFSSEVISEQKETVIRNPKRM